MRNQTSELRILLSDALPLTHRDSMMSEFYYEEVYPEFPFFFFFFFPHIFYCHFENKKVFTRLSVYSIYICKLLLIINYIYIFKQFYNYICKLLFIIEFPFLTPHGNSELFLCPTL